MHKAEIYSMGVVGIELRVIEVRFPEAPPSAFVDCFGFDVSASAECGYCVRDRVTGRTTTLSEIGPDDYEARFDGEVIYRNDAVRERGPLDSDPVARAYAADARDAIRAREIARGGGRQGRG